MTTPTQTLVVLVRETAHYVQSPAERERLLAAAEAVEHPKPWRPDLIEAAEQIVRSAYQNGAGAWGLRGDAELQLSNLQEAVGRARDETVQVAPWTRAASDQVRDLHAANNALLERARKAEAALAAIGKRARSDGDRTMDDLMRDMGWIDDEVRRAAAHKPLETFQARVSQWMHLCFTPEIAADRLERNDRFIEEALELTQASGYSRERAHALVDYVFDRPQGEINQEVGGVMVTLAAHCLAHGVDMMAGAETELARICDPTIMAKIKAKQAAKPTGSALPVPQDQLPPLGHFCPACMAIPQAGYCNLNGCPTKPGAAQ